MSGADAAVRRLALAGRPSKAFQLLLEAEAGQQGCSFPTCVILAEAAIAAEDFTLSSAVMSKIGFAQPHHNQFFIRLLLCRGLYEIHIASMAHGVAALSGSLRAAATAVEAMVKAAELQDSGDAVALVYNATVLHWFAVRPLFREGAHQYAVPSLAVVVRQLTDGRAADSGVQEADVHWLARNTLALAWAQHASGDVVGAASSLQLASSLAGEAASSLSAALRAEVHSTQLTITGAKPALDSISISDIAPSPRVSAEQHLDMLHSLQALQAEAHTAAQLPSSPQDAAARGSATKSKSKASSSLAGSLSVTPGSLRSTAAAEGELVGMLMSADPVAAKEYMARSDAAAAQHFMDARIAESQAAIRAAHSEAAAASTPRSKGSRKGKASAPSTAPSSPSPADAAAERERAEEGVAAVQAMGPLPLLTHIAYTAALLGLNDLAGVVLHRITQGTALPPPLRVIADMTESLVLAQHLTPAVVLESQRRVADGSVPAATAAALPKRGLQSAALTLPAAEPLTKDDVHYRQGAANAIDAARSADDSAADGLLSVPFHRRLQASAVQQAQLIRQGDAIAAAERAVQTAQRSGSGALLETAAVHAFNMCVPLLRSGHGGMVLRCLGSCATALASCASGMVALRARCHSLLAHLELQEGQLSRAAEHAASVLALDYAPVDSTLANIAHNRKNGVGVGDTTGLMAGLGAEPIQPGALTVSGLSEAPQEASAATLQQTPASAPSTTRSSKSKASTSKRAGESTLSPVPAAELLQQLAQAAAAGYFPNEYPGSDALEVAAEAIPGKGGKASGGKPKKDADAGPPGPSGGAAAAAPISARSVPLSTGRAAQLQQRQEEGKEDSKSVDSDASSIDEAAAQTRGTELSALSPAGNNALSDLLGVHRAMGRITSSQRFSQGEASLDRALDRFVLPLSKQVQLATAVYDEPEGDFEKAAAALLQASAATTSNGTVPELYKAVDHLGRCASLLLDAPGSAALALLCGAAVDDATQGKEDDEPGAGAATTQELTVAPFDPTALPDGAAGGVPLRRLHMAWARVAELSSQHGALELSRRACRVLMGVRWDVQTHPDMALAQAMSCLHSMDATAQLFPHVHAVGTDACVVRGTAGSSSSLKAADAAKGLRRSGGSTGLHASVLRVSPLAVIAEVSAERSRRRLGVSHASASRPGTSFEAEALQDAPSVLHDQCFDGIGRLSVAAAEDVMRGLSALGPAPDAAVWRAQAVGRSVLPGYDVAGTPDAVKACKAALSVACINACRLGTALGRADLVHNACAKLWNSHRHVWSGASSERSVATHRAASVSATELEGDSVFMAAAAGLGDPRYGATYASGMQLAPHLRQAMATAIAALMATGCQDTHLLCCFSEAAAGACEVASAAAAAAGNAAAARDELQRGMQLATAPFRRLAAAVVWRGAPGQSSDGVFVGLAAESAAAEHPADLPADLRMIKPGAYTAARGFLPTPLPRPSVALPLLQLAVRLQLRLSLLDAPSAAPPLQQLLDGAVALTVGSSTQLATEGASDPHATASICDGGSPQLLSLCAALVVLSAATGSQCAAFVDCGSGPGACLAQVSAGCVAPASTLHTAHSSSVPGGLPLAVTLEYKREALAMAIAALAPAAAELGVRAAPGKLEALGLPARPEPSGDAESGSGKRSSSPSPKKSARDSARSKSGGAKGTAAGDDEPCVLALASALDSLAMAALDAKVPGSDSAALKALFAAGGAASPSAKGSRASSFKGPSAAEGGDAETGMSQAALIVRRTIAARLRMSTCAFPAAVAAQADSPGTVLPQADYAKALAWACSWADESIAILAQVWAQLATHACGMWSLRAAQRASAAALALVPSEPARQRQLGVSTHGRAFRWFALAGSTWGKAIAAMVSHRAAVAAVTAVLHEAEERGEVQLGGASASSTPRGRGKKASSKDTQQRSVSKVEATTLARSTEDSLRLLALSKMCIGLHWAAAARSQHTAVSTAVQALAIATPLMGNPVTRSALQPHLRRLTESLCLAFAPPVSGTSSRGGAAAPKALSMDAAAANVTGDLFQALLVCHADVADWSGGLKIAEDAFALLPSSQHSKLWPSRVVFQARLGHDVAHGLQQLRVQLQKQEQQSAQGKAGPAGKSDPALLGRLWLSLARASSDPGDQLSALSAALEVTQGMFARVHGCFALAEWCTRQRLPASDTRDALHSAADILLEVVQPSAGKSRDLHAMDGSDDADSSVWGGSTVLSRSVMSRGAGSAARGGASPGSTAGTSLRSGVRPPPSRQSNRTGSGIVSVVGADDANPSSNGDWPLQPTIEHVEMLVRAFTQLAAVAPSATQRRQYTLRATYFVQVAWGMAVAASNRVMAEAAFNRLSPQQRAAVLDAAGGYDWWVEERVATGTPYSVPADQAGWVALAASVASHPWWGALPPSSFSPPAPEATSEGKHADAAELPDVYKGFAVPHPLVAQGEGWVFFVAPDLVPEAMRASHTDAPAGNTGSDGRSTLRSSAPNTSAMQSDGASSSMTQAQGGVVRPSAVLAGCELTLRAAHHAALVSSWKAPESSQQPFMLCASALSKPALTLGTLVQLAQLLVADGEYPAASPVLLLALHTADSLMKHRMHSSFEAVASVPALMRVLLLQWCDAMDMHVPAAVLRQALGLDAGRHGCNDGRGAGKLNLNLTPAAQTASAVVALAPDTGDAAPAKSATSTPRGAAGGAAPVGEPATLPLPGVGPLQLQHSGALTAAQLSAAQVAAAAVLSSCAPLAFGGIGTGPPAEEVTAFEGEVSLWEQAQAQGGLTAAKAAPSIADAIMGVPAVQVRAVSSTSAELDIHQIWLDLALAAAGAGSLVGALKWLEPAERHARAFRDPDMLARSQLLRASSMFHRGSALEATEAAAQAMAGFGVYVTAPQGSLEAPLEALMPAGDMPGVPPSSSSGGVQLTSLGSAPITLWEASSMLIVDALAWGSHKGDALPLLLATSEAAERAGRPHVLDMPQVLDTVHQAAKSKAKAAKNLASMVAIGSAAGIALATKAARSAAAKASAKEAADAEIRVKAPAMHLLQGPLAQLSSVSADAVALVTGTLDARHAASTLLRSAAAALTKHSQGDAAASEAVQVEMQNRLQQAVDKCRTVAPVPRAPPSNRHRHAPLPSALSKTRDDAHVDAAVGVAGGHISLSAMEAAVRLHTATGVALTATALAVRQANSDSWREDWTQAALHFMRAIALGHSLGMRAPLAAACTAFAQALVAVPGGEPTWWDDLQIPETPVSQAQLASAQASLRVPQSASIRAASAKWTTALHAPTAPAHDVQSPDLARLLLVHSDSRATAIRDATCVLRFALEEVCQPWSSACPSGGMQSIATHVGPAQRATSAVQCMLVDTLVLSSLAEARPVMLAERALLHAVQDDPVAMYLHSQGASAEEIASAERSGLAAPESKAGASMPQSSVRHPEALQEALVHAHALLAASDIDGGLRGAALLRLGLASAAAANAHTGVAVYTSSAASDLSAALAQELPVLTIPPTQGGAAGVARITLADAIWWPRQAGSCAPVRVYAVAPPAPAQEEAQPAKGKKSPRASKKTDTTEREEPTVLQVDACTAVDSMELVTPPAWTDPLTKRADAAAPPAELPDGKTKVSQRAKTPPKGSSRGATSEQGGDDIDTTAAAASAVQGSAALLLGTVRQLGLPWATALEALLGSRPGDVLHSGGSEEILFAMQHDAEDATSAAAAAASQAASSRPGSAKGGKSPKGSKKSSKSPRTASSTDLVQLEDQYRLAAHRVPLAVDSAGAAEHGSVLHESMQLMHPAAVEAMRTVHPFELRKAVVRAVSAAVSSAPAPAAAAAAAAAAAEADAPPAETDSGAMPLSALPQQALQEAVEAIVHTSLGMQHPPASVSIPRSLVDHHAKAMAALHAAVAVGTAASDWNTVGEAAYHLAELYGTAAPSRAAAALSLHQSARVRSRLLQLLVEAGRDADTKTAELARGSNSDDIIGGGEGAGELVLMLRSVLAAEAAHCRGLQMGGHMAGVGGLHGNLGSGFVHSSGGYGPASASSAAVSSSAPGVGGQLGVAAGCGVAGVGAQVGTMLLRSASSSSPLSHPQYRRTIAELSRICLAYQLLDCSRPWHGCLAALPAGHRLAVLQLSPAADALLLTVTWRLPAVHDRPSAASSQVAGACGMHVSSVAARCALSPEAAAALVTLLRDLQDFRRSSEVTVAALEGSHAGQGGAWLDFEAVSAASASVEAAGFVVDAPPFHPLSMLDDGDMSGIDARTGQALLLDESASRDLAASGMGLPPQGCLPSCPALPPKPTAAGAPAEDTANEQLCGMMARAEALLAPLFSSAVQAAVAGPAPLVLCVDPSLEALPLEALSHLQAASSISREFSMQFMGNRAAAVATAMHPDAARPPVGSLPTPLSTMQLLAQSESSAGARALDAHVALNKRNCIYIVDPLADDFVPGDWAGDDAIAASRPQSAASDSKGKGKGKSKGKAAVKDTPQHIAPPVQLLSETLPEGLSRHSTTAQFNSLVKPALPSPTGTDARQPAPSSQQWLGLLTRGKLIDGTDASVTEFGTDVGGDGADAAEGSRDRSMLLYTGPTPLLQVLQPELLVGLDARLTGLVVLAGGTSTDAAFRRAARLRNAQSAARQGLANPYATAALLSMAGVAAVAMNSWGSTVSSSMTLLRDLLEPSAAHTAPASTGPSTESDGTLLMASSDYVSIARKLRSSLHTAVQLPAGEGQSGPLVLPKQRVRGCMTVYGMPTVHLSDE